jgi:hypothetical protein
MAIWLCLPAPASAGEIAETIADFYGVQSVGPLVASVATQQSLRPGAVLYFERNQMPSAPKQMIALNDAKVCVFGNANVRPNGGVNLPPVVYGKDAANIRREIQQFMGLRIDSNAEVDSLEVSITNALFYRGSSEVIYDAWIAARKLCASVKTSSQVSVVASTVLTGIVTITVRFLSPGSADRFLNENGSSHPNFEFLRQGVMIRISSPSPVVLGIGLRSPPSPG